MGRVGSTPHPSTVALTQAPMTGEPTEERKDILVKMKALPTKINQTRFPTKDEQLLLRTSQRNPNGYSSSKDQTEVNSNTKRSPGFPIYQSISRGTNISCISNNYCYYLHFKVYDSVETN
ncbi:hypothetical protein GW17_00034567 [Ensete ventricosum]|nr:hypothetical protein GW17_00034567 [Ensete ventricosum]